MIDYAALLQRKLFFIREHVGMLKLANTYDIFDGETKVQIGIAKENPGWLIHILRLLINKQFLPTRVDVFSGTDPQNATALLFSIKRGMVFLRSKIEILDPQGAVIGWFQSKVFSIGGAFNVFDALGNQVALVKGDWKGWTFKITNAQEAEIGTVTKKWAGIGKELFTSADNYVLALNDLPNAQNATLLLAAGLAVDTIYKEH